MNICENYAALLDLYIDGELSAAEMEAVQQHLAVCPACQTYVDDGFAIRAAFPAVEDTVLPENFSAGVMAAVAAAPRANQTRRKSARRWTRAIAPLAACCAIVLFVQNTNGASEKSAPMAAGSSSSTSTAVAASAAMEDRAMLDGGAVMGMAKAESEVMESSMVTMDAPAPDSDEQFAATGGTISAVTGGTASAVISEILCLSPEQAAEFLPDHTPEKNEAGVLCCTLNAAEFAALVDALEQTGVERNVTSDTGDLPAGYVLVYQAD